MSRHHQSHAHPSSSSSPFHSSRHSSHRSHPPSSSKDQKQKNKPKNLLATLSMMGLAIGATMLVENGPWKSRAAAAATVVGLETVLESGGFFDGEERERGGDRSGGGDRRMDAGMRKDKVRDRCYENRVDREREEARSGEGRRDRYTNRDDWERDEEEIRRVGGGAREWRNIDEWRRGVRAETANRRVYDESEDEDEEYEFERRRRETRARTPRRGRDEGAGYESTSRRRRNGPANANERFDAKYEIEEV